MELIVPEVEKARRGDRQAYARLVEKHQRVVASIALAITTDLGEAEDAAQEAFLEGWRDLRKLENLAAFSPWICQIARNRAYDIVRKRKKTEPATEEELEGAPDPAAGALETLEEGESAALIHRALQALPEEGRETMILYYREGKSVAQVAESLQVSEEVVRKRLSRARERIRESVEAALGAALIALPVGDLSSQVLGRISTHSWLSRLRVRRAPLHLLRPAAKVVLVGAAAAVGVHAMVQSQVWRVPGPASIRGKVVGAKDASGTVTLELKDGPRVAKVEHGAFRMGNVPPGTWRLTYALDGVSNPTPNKVVIEPGEVLQVELKVSRVGIQGGTPFGDEVIAAQKAEKSADLGDALAHWEAALPLAPDGKARTIVNQGIERAKTQLQQPPADATNAE